MGEVLAEIYTEFKKKRRKYAGFYFLYKPNLIIIDLDLIKTIMTKDFNYFTDHIMYANEEQDPLSAHLFTLKGEKWRKLRGKLSSTFSSGKIKTMFPILVNCSRGLINIIDECIETHQAVDIKDLGARYTTDVIGSIAFGIDCDSLNNPNSQFRKYGIKIFDLNFFETIRDFVGFLEPRVLNFFKAKIVKKDVSEFFMNVVRETVEYREKNNVKRNDFMQLLIELKNAKDNESKPTLTLNELAAQAFVFYVAGFESSSTTLTFCIYELSENLGVQRKLRQEIFDVLKKHDFKLTYEALNEMTYLDKCVTETLRKYPPVPVLDRVCTKRYRIPGTELDIEKGIAVHIPLLGIQRDPDLYPNPLKFDPERFSTENKAQHNQFAWLPFGEGPRMCIGMRFGLMQTKVALSVLIKNYNFTLNNKTIVPLALNSKTFLLSVKDGVWLTVEKICNSRINC
ncbi:hypothetical protein FQR65_LT01177 [Abscondita terminalis]|nr:hypothetical protein FQR65_LT01177 [Abscondita terminalis]